MPSSVRASVVFPLPDSPTRPSVSPGQTAALTSVSAWTSCPRWRKTFVSSWISTTGGPASLDRRKLEIRSLLARELRRALVVPAAAVVAALDGDQRRLFLAAALVGERAAVGEHASRDLRAEAREVPGDRVEPAAILPHAPARNAAEEADRVRVTRILEDGLHRSLLDEATGVEDADPGAHLRDDAEVVADEEHRRVQLGLELRDEVEDLGLHRRVEPCRRLVENQQRGIFRERHRDHDTLLHPAGELMRVAGHHRARVGDLDTHERVACPLLGLLRRVRRAP